jgi:hypothetical protein
MKVITSMLSQTLPYLSSPDISLTFAWQVPGALAH